MKRQKSFTLLMIVSCLFLLMGMGEPVHAANSGDVVINEIAWMGTTYSYYDEWIELYNPTNTDIDLTGWQLDTTDGSVSITLSGIIPAHSYYLLERTDDSSVLGVMADLTYAGSLSNTGQTLNLTTSTGQLIDTVDQWYAGDNSSKASMERTDPLIAGTSSTNWNTASTTYDGGLGTPKAVNSHTTLTDPKPIGSTGGNGTSDTWYDLYFSDNLNTVMPEYGPKVMATALVNAINSATTSIEFAIYGMSDADEIHQALLNAVDRGVQVRGVVDTDASGYSYYRDTQWLIDSLPTGAVVSDHDDRIMHNKFFVIDDASVWTGSTNISGTGIMAEYNSNWSIYVRHAGLAQAFKTEFEEMYLGNFHDLKTDNTQHTFPALADGSVIESYFSPTDDATHNSIIPTINGATDSLYIKIFYLTDPEIGDAIIAAHNRGVDVKMIIDATGAENEFSEHRRLRAAGIPVKVENWGGKEHMKSLVADGYKVIIGSQNWTSAGNLANDENLLYIENMPLGTAYTNYFTSHWNWIPDTWLTNDPEAESVDSVGSVSDFMDNDHDGLTDEGAPEQLNSIETGPGAINIYFNKGALDRYATANNKANYHVNLEHRLIERINQANSTIDMAVYELNLPDVVDALLARAAAGVQVRMIADAKDASTDAEHDARYELMRVELERLARGLDNQLGTADDVTLFSDSPLFAVEDPLLRQQYGLPASPEGIDLVTVEVGNTLTTGYLFVKAEVQSDGSYYSPGNQMHNKFAIFDGSWVWTGSWNFTETGLYGSEENRLAGILGGNSQHAVELNSPDLASIFKTEFDEMWGSSSLTPDPLNSNYHSRKTDNTAHSVTVGSRIVDVYFSPGDNAIGHVTDYVRNNANVNTYFTIFAWSDQALTDELKYLWEGSKTDQVGTLTGFDLKGVFDASFWNMWWSASVDMTGRVASQVSLDNPNTRWANPAPVMKSNEDRKLHSKTMIIDAGTTSDPTVIVGSTNWSDNGNEINDENMLFIHDAEITNQFVQEFYGRYLMGGGEIPAVQ